MKIFKSDSITGTKQEITIHEALSELGEFMLNMLMESKCISRGNTFWNIEISEGKA
jgi:hypothetical protein